MTCVVWRGRTQQVNYVDTKKGHHQSLDEVAHTTQTWQPSLHDVVYVAHAQQGFFPLYFLISFKFSPRIQIVFYMVPNSFITL